VTVRTYDTPNMGEWHADNDLLFKRMVGKYKQKLKENGATVGSAELEGSGRFDRPSGDVR